MTVMQAQQSKQASSWFSEAAAVRKAGQTVSALVVIAVFLLMSRYLYLGLPKYTTFTVASYTAHFFQQIPWFVPHVIGGMIAFTVGPMQFVPYLRRRFRKLHRGMGMLYVGGITVGGITSLMLIPAIESGWAVKLGMLGFSLAWMMTTGLAVRAVLQKQWQQHGRWMFRSYVLTLSFSIIRIGNEALAKFGMTSADNRILIMIWAGWLIPLFSAEIAMRLFFPLRAKRAPRMSPAAS